MPPIIGHNARIFINNVEVPFVGVIEWGPGSKARKRQRRLKRASKKYRWKKGRRKQ